MITTKLVPVLVLILLLGGIWGIGYKAGGDSVHRKWQKERASIALAHAKEVERLQAVNRRVEVRYIDRVQPVLQRQKERIKYVTKYITKEDNSKCSISPSFVELHDSAAEDRVPSRPSPSEFVAGVAPPELSDVAETVADNYGKFHEMRVQCEALQEWASELSKQPHNPVDRTH